MKNQAPKNLTELFHRQANVYNKLENKEIEIGEAEEMNNAAGKMIKIAALRASIVDPEDAKTLNILQ
jgi:phosphopantetheine adenylyltransferase